MERPAALCEVNPEHGPGSHGDHVLARRLAQTCEGKDPDCDLNVMDICATCHGIKTAAERKLYRGDRLGFMQVLRCGGWDMERVERAFRFYGY